MMLMRDAVRSFWILWCLVFLQIIRTSTAQSNDDVIKAVEQFQQTLAVKSVLVSQGHDIVFGRKTTLLIYGSELIGVTDIALTNETATSDLVCSENKTIHFQNANLVSNGTLLQFQGDLPLNRDKPIGPSGFLYVCARKGPNAKYQHLGDKFGLKLQTDTPRVNGFRVFGSNKISIDDESGAMDIPADTLVTIQLFGTGFTRRVSLAFTQEPAEYGESCEDITQSKIVKFTDPSVEIIRGDIAIIKTKFPPSQGNFYFCMKNENTVWFHQGSTEGLFLSSSGPLIPVWAAILCILICLTLSGLFSGLNLGLMALDKTELKVVESCGTPTERKCAKAIAPLRNHGNYLLCSLLLGNVLVNNTLTIMLDGLTSGLVAVLGATMAIVIFGEIIPQAFCSRHGLEVGAHTVVITKIFMLITFPASYPISMVLDYCLGEEIGKVYDRAKLVEYIRLTMHHSQLASEEVNMISGALELKTKRAREVMTTIENVFMLPYETILNFEALSQIIREGYTRIPVYDGSRNSIVALLNTKDLAFVDPNHNIPLKTVCDFYKHPLAYCFDDQRLDELLDEFKKGKSHMSIVRTIREEENSDPTYTVVGIVTLEDVIEEILKIEIVDETDTVIDNRERKKRKENQQLRQDFSDFARPNVNNSVIPAPLAVATFQFLSTAVEPFKRDFVSENVLRRLMAQNIFIQMKPDDVKDENRKYIYKAFKNSDYFVLLLEGRAKVTLHTSAKENLEYEAGSFSYFGVPAIFAPPKKDGTKISPTVPPSDTLHLPDKVFCPDYSVEAKTELLYMRVHRNVYAAAYKASRLDRSNKSNALPSADSEWANDLLNAVKTSNNRPTESSGGRGPLAKMLNSVAAASSAGASAVGKSRGDLLRALSREDTPLLTSTSNRGATSLSTYGTQIERHQSAIAQSTKRRNSAGRLRSGSLVPLAPLARTSDGSIGSPSKPDTSPQAMIRSPDAVAIEMTPTEAAYTDPFLQGMDSSRPVETVDENTSLLSSLGSSSAPGNAK